MGSGSRGRAALVAAATLAATLAAPTAAPAAVKKHPLGSAVAALLHAGERSGVQGLVRFPTLTAVFGRSGPKAYARIDKSLLGLLPGTTAHAAVGPLGGIPSSSIGHEGSVEMSTGAKSTRRGGGANDGPLTDTGQLVDTASDSSRSAVGQRNSSWKVQLDHPCPTGAGVLTGTASGGTYRHVEEIVARHGKMHTTFSYQILAKGTLKGLVGDDARLKLVTLALDFTVINASGDQRANAHLVASVGDIADHVAVTGPDAAEIRDDGVTRTLAGVITAAGQRLLTRAEAIWRTPNRCAKLALVASPARIDSGQKAAVKATATARRGERVGGGKVKATPTGATVDPATRTTDATGVARFTVTARSSAAALTAALTSRAGIANAALTLGQSGGFLATLEAVRTETWTGHTSRPSNQPPPVPANCETDSQGTETIGTPPEKLDSTAYYSDADGLGGYFQGFLVLRRDATYNDNCGAGASDTSGCGQDTRFATLNDYTLKTSGEVVDVTIPVHYTNRPAVSCPSYEGPFCDDTVGQEADHPAPLSRDAFRDPSRKTITLHGSTTWTLQDGCNSGGTSITGQDQVTLDWTITFTRQ